MALEGPTVKLLKPEPSLPVSPSFLPSGPGWLPGPHTTRPTGELCTAAAIRPQLSRPPHYCRFLLGTRQPWTWRAQGKATPAACCRELGSGRTRTFQTSVHCPHPCPPGLSPVTHGLVCDYDNTGAKSTHLRPPPAPARMEGRGPATTAASSPCPWPAPPGPAPRAGAPWQRCTST